MIVESPFLKMERECLALAQEFSWSEFHAEHFSSLARDARLLYCWDEGLPIQGEFSSLMETLIEKHLAEQTKIFDFGLPA